MTPETAAPNGSGGRRLAFTVCAASGTGQRRTEGLNMQAAAGITSRQRHTRTAAAVAVWLAGTLLPGAEPAPVPEASPVPAPSTPATTEPAAAAVKPMRLNLAQCEELALQNNHQRPASRWAVAMAEAQHRQALAAYWPQVTLKAAALRTDEQPNFLFPATTYPVPAQSLPLPAGNALVTIPAGAFGPGFPPANVQLPVAVPPQTIDTPAQQLAVPDQDVKLLDEVTYSSTVQAQWLLYDGGMRAGMRRQARAGIAAAREEVRRTDLQLLDSVRRLYYGAVLAQQLVQVAHDTLERMETTLRLTETMYKEGSGTVKKTDYLDNKVVVETLRAAVALLEKNEAMARAALAYTAGFDWNQSIAPEATEIPFAPARLDLQTLVSTSYQFSPDWKRLEAGLQAAEGAVDETRSGHYPKVALTGELHRWWNESETGLATAENKEGWSVGIGMELPLCDGFLTRHRVAAAKARFRQLQDQQLLLKEGLGLQVREVVLGLTATQRQFQATQDAMLAATDNRDLNIRAYQNGLVETEKVIRAQLMEAFMCAQHYKIRYDHAELLSRLSVVVGTEIQKQLQDSHKE